MVRGGKAYMNLPSLGRSVDHVRGYRVQLTLNLLVHVHCKQHTQRLEFQVLTKMVFVQKHYIASDESLSHAIAFLGPSFGSFDSPHMSKGALTQKTKGDLSDDNERPINENTMKVETSKRAKIVATASIVYLSSTSDDDIGTISPNSKRTNTRAFANLKSAKKGYELSAIGRGFLQIEKFCLPAFIFSNDELEDTLLGLDPLTEHGCTAASLYQ
jgi:hypothetical protein